MASLSATDKIRKILAEAQAEADKLKAEALAELKEKLKAAQAVVHSIEEEIEELGGKAPQAKGGGSSRKRITIEEVVSAIKAGNKNYPAIANYLGCSAANVASKIKAEGKKAGITKTGERAAMVLGVK